MSPKTSLQALKICFSSPRRFPGQVRSYRVIHNPVGGDLSPKTSLQALKICFSSPRRFPGQVRSYNGDAPHNPVT